MSWHDHENFGIHQIINRLESYYRNPPLKIQIFKEPGTGFDYNWTISWKSVDNKFKGKISINTDDLGPAIQYDMINKFHREFKSKHPEYFL
jgi:hypothetical protein